MKTLIINESEALIIEIQNNMHEALKEIKNLNKISQNLRDLSIDLVNEKALKIIRECIKTLFSLKQENTKIEELYKREAEEKRMQDEAEK